MANLSATELLKYDWRIDKFISKYKNQESFELSGGQKVGLVFNEETLKALSSKKNAIIFKIEFVNSRSKNIKYKITSFKKNEEFGGKPAGKGAGVDIEMREINSINNQIANILSKTGDKSVPIKIKTKIYNVTRCHKTPGVPKSDFYLTDDLGNEVVWISHKEGSSAKDFQQWGGMTEKVIREHPEVEQFIKQIQDMFPDGITKATTIAKYIKDQTLKKYAVYGVDYGAGRAMGRQNVSLVLQGAVKISKVANGYAFDANHAHENGESITGPFEPVMMAVYKGDRSNFGVQGARFGIHPAQSRNVTKWI
jgi:hypothetical protein